MAIPTQCTLCPRNCGANRLTSRGLCHGGSALHVARAAPHFWEEPCISGTRGSGAVFFAGCPLACSFCQNHSISHHCGGKPIGTVQLAQIFLQLQNQGVHNLNLVTATQYAPWVVRSIALARRRGLHLPVVWNTGGYESQTTLATLQNSVDVWLTDLKFYSPTLASSLAKAPDYFKVASAALQRMCQMAGPPLLQNGLLQKGVIVRLLVLPGHRQDAKQLLHWLAANLPAKSFLLSLMSQYTPPQGIPLPAPLNRRISSFEYNDVVNTAVKLGLTLGFSQQRSSAQAKYTPAFDGTGVPKET